MEDLVRRKKAAEFRYEEETRIRIDFEHKINNLTNENRLQDRKNILLISKIKEQEALNKEREFRIKKNQQIILEQDHNKTRDE